MFDQKQGLNISTVVTRTCVVLIFLLGNGLSTSAIAVPIGAAPVSAPQPEYIFGVFPFLPPRELEQVFAPIAAEFARVLGRKVQFTTSSSFEAYVDRLANQEFDVSFMQPFDYVRAADQHGYVPLAARGEQLKALFVTAPDSTVKTLNDLRGKRVSLPPIDSAVSQLARLHLRKNGLVPGQDVTLVYFRSHISCMQQVLIEASAACGAGGPPLRYFNKRMKIEMRIMSESESIPHTLFAAHPRVPVKDRELLLENIMSWANTPEGKVILERGKMTPFTPVTNDDYNVVRKFPRE